MSDVGIVFKDFEFTFNGQTWKFGRPTLAVEKAYAKSRELAELHAIQRHQNNMKKGTFAVLMDGWLSGASNNRYGWNSPSFLASLNMDEANLIHLLWCWIGEFYNSARASVGKCDGKMILTEEALRNIFYSSDEMKATLSKLVSDALIDPNPLQPSAN